MQCCVLAGSFGSLNLNEFLLRSRCAHFSAGSAGASQPVSVAVSEGASGAARALSPATTGGADASAGGNSRSRSPPAAAAAKKGARAELSDAAVAIRNMAESITHAQAETARVQQAQLQALQQRLAGRPAVNSMTFRF